jgi:hypothetical protein
MAPRVHTLKQPPKPLPTKPPETAELAIATTVPLETIAEDSTSEVTEDVPVDEGQGSSVVPQAMSTDAALSDFEDNDDSEEDLSLLEESSPIDTTTIAEEEPEEGFLEIFNENCLSCKELVPFAKKSFKRKGCHFTTGNKNCPAESTTIVIRVPLEEIVPRFRTAEKERDFARLAKLNALLATKPDWYQQRVAQALDNERLKDI